MPVVRSYFRRAPGAAAAAAAESLKRIDVAVYGPDGVELLRESTGGRHGVRNVEFASGLPGGFAEASFQLPAGAARHWPGRAGLRCIIRRGQKVLWWGWVEDVRDTLGGGADNAKIISCLGPWQQLEQRRFSPSYSGTLYSNNAIQEALFAYCDEISTDYSLFEASGVDVGTITWTNETVSRLVKLACELGNTAGNPMLFAVWEPSMGHSNGYPTAINRNPSFEEMDGSNLVGWTSTVVTGTPVSSLLSGTYLSPVRSVKWVRGPEAGTQTGRLQTDSAYYIPVAAGTDYVVDYWVYFGATGSISCYARMNWYNSGGGLISQVALTTRNSTGSAFGARYVEETTSPALAVECRLDLVFGLPDSGAQSYLVFDDAYMYEPGAAVEVDRKPRARFWARDLSTYDYLLYTSELSRGLTVDTTTRELANYVVASYGSSSYTAAAQDTASQALYRRRDGIVAAGNVGATAAAAVRDVYLERFSEPADEPGSFSLERPGALRTARGLAVWPEDLRAGDRVRIADGRLAGMTFVMDRVTYSDGVVTGTPQRTLDVPRLLAKLRRQGDG